MGDALDRARLFAGLSSAMRDELRAISTPFAIASGTALFRQGDPPTGLFVLEEGLLEIATRMPGDEEAWVSRIAPGDVVGEFALLDPGPRSARVVAVVASRGLFIPARAFIAQLDEGRHGAVAAVDRLRALVAGRARATLDRLTTDFSVERSELRAAAGPGALENVPLAFETLRALGRFAPFDDAAGDAFLTQGRGVAIGRGTLLANAARPVVDAVLVVRGAIRAAIPRNGGQEQVTIHGPGEWTGLIANIDGGAHPLTLSAAEDSLLFRVPQATFADWRAAPGAIELAVLAGVDRQLVRDQRRANRHVGRAVALQRFNAIGEAA